MAIAEILKYEGDNSTFVWKHPIEDFNSLTQLIVHDSQEALFVLNGEVLDIFGAGRYTLETQNIPKLGKALNRNTNDKTPFHCEVYFVNKTEQMSIKWGTDSRVEFIEPTYGFPLSIGASGEMTLRAEDSKKLLLKLVGTEKYLSQARLVSYFRSFLMTKVKSYIAQTIRAEKINIFEIDEKLEALSKNLWKLLVPDFADYGVALERFFVMNVVKPDGEAQYEKFKSLHFRQYADVMEAKLRQQISVIDAETSARKTVIESQAMATKRAQEGYTYQQERGFDVAERVAQNEAVGQMTNLGVGLGTMAGVGGAVAGTVGGAMKDALSDTQNKCSNCGAVIVNGAKFCNECGQKVAPVQVETIVCPNCNNTVVKGKFCPECGDLFDENDYAGLIPYFPEYTYGFRVDTINKDIHDYYDDIENKAKKEYEKEINSKLKEIVESDSVTIQLLKEDVSMADRRCEESVKKVKTQRNILGGSTVVSLLLLVLSLL